MRFPTGYVSGMSAAKPGQRLSLTKSHLASPVGLELFNLLSDIGKDGVLEYEELERLSDFLNRNKDSNIPGVSFLFNLMIEVCEDQKIASEELVEIQLGIERVLPPNTRTEIRRNRLALIPPPLPETATERQLDYIRILGGHPLPGLSKWDASELIDAGSSAFVLRATRFEIHHRTLDRFLERPLREVTSRHRNISGGRVSSSVARWRELLAEVAACARESCARRIGDAAGRLAVFRTRA
jgi:hypothetical protein